MADHSRSLWALVAMFAVLPACGDSTDAEQPGAGTTDVVATRPASTIVPEGFDSVVVTLSAPGRDAVERTLWYAGTPEQWRQGLMGVTGLGEATGMLFEFDREGSHQFYMWQTPLPLDIFFFDADHDFVASAAMTPCLEGSSSGCERYSPSRPFLTAIEVPAGSLDDLGVDEEWSIAYDDPTEQSTTEPGG